MASGSTKDRVRLRALGRAVRDQRQSIGLSQEALAQKARLDRTYVSGIERGVRNPTIRSLWTLAEALGVPASALLIQAEGLTEP